MQIKLVKRCPETKTLWKMNGFRVGVGLVTSAVTCAGENTFPLVPTKTTISEIQQETKT